MAVKPHVTAHGKKRPAFVFCCILLVFCFFGHAGMLFDVPPQGHPHQGCRLVALTGEKHTIHCTNIACSKLLKLPAIRPGGLIHGDTMVTVGPFRSFQGSIALGAGFTYAYVLET